MGYIVWLLRNLDFKSFMSGRFVDEGHHVFGGSGVYNCMGMTSI